VLKRDGRIVDFNQAKIAEAILKPFKQERKKIKFS